MLWGPDLRLGSGRTEVEFDSAYLRLPVVQDLAALKTFLRSAPQGLVIRFRNQNGLAAVVYRHLRARRYGQWPTLQAMAEQQGISASTFRRQLEREGRSYQQIKDEVRRAMAFERLREGVLSIAEIAEQTGFQSPAPSTALSRNGPVTVRAAIGRDWPIAPARRCQSRSSRASALTRVRSPLATLATRLP